MHWLFMDEINRIYYTLSVSTTTSHVSLTEIPIKVHAANPRPPIPCIAGGGRLAFVTIDDLGLTEIWTKQEQDDDDREHGQECNGVWKCSELADLGSERVDLVFFAEIRGALLVEQGGTFSVVDLKSKEKTSVHIEEEGTEHVKGTSWFTGSCSSSSSCRHPGMTCLHTPHVLYEMYYANDI